MIRAAGWVLLSALVLIGCASPTEREISMTQPDRVATAATPVATAPQAEFRGMWGYERGDEYHLAQQCGWLYIDEPYVLVLFAESDWVLGVDFDLDSVEVDSVDSSWIILPRSGTRYDPQSRSLWVWDDGPMTDSDYVCVGGSGGETVHGALNVHERNPWYATSMHRVEHPG